MITIEVDHQNSCSTIGNSVSVNTVSSRLLDDFFRYLKFKVLNSLVITDYNY